MSTHGLKPFRTELIRAARRREPRRARPRVTTVSISALAVLAAGGTAFATGLVGPDPDSPADLTPVPSTAALVATAPDPGGNLAWGLRVSDSKSGGVCFTVNRVKDGRYGRLAANGSFTELPSGRGESCGPAPAPNDSLVGSDAAAQTLVIHGVAGRDVTAVHVGATRLEPTARGGWIATFKGDTRDLPEHPVKVVARDGSFVTYPWTGPPIKTPAN